MAKKKPNKGKAVRVKVDGKTRSVGQKGKTPQPGTKKGDAYCARSAGIKKCKNPPCPMISLVSVGSVEVRNQSDMAQLNSLLIEAFI